MMKSHDHKKISGFTLIEMMVAVFVFSVVMVLSTGAIFSIVNANKTSQAIKSVMDNLSSALDSMSRDIRYGTEYDCGSTGSGNNGNDCAEGGANDYTFSFKNKDDEMITYIFEPSSGTGNSEAIFKCNGVVTNTSNAGCTRLTAEEVHVTNLHFYVLGAERGVDSQPLVLITISGYAQAGSNKSYFNIETMVDQRSLDVCKTFDGWPEYLCQT